MKFFKRKLKTNANPLLNTVMPEEILTAREAVNTLSGNLKSSSDQHRLDAQRMATLNKTINKMEAALAHTGRIEVENTRLSSELRGVEQKLRQKSAWADEQEKKIAALKKQRDDLSQRYEDSKVELAQRDDWQKTHIEKMAEQQRKLVSFEAEKDHDKDLLNAERYAVDNLRKDVARQTAELATQRRRLAELQKSSEEMTAQLGQKTMDSDLRLKELRMLRVEHTDLKEKLFEARSELQTVTYNLKTQKTLFEDTLKRREDELSGLKNQVDQFNTQMRIQENTSSHYDDEISALRQALEVERARNDRNEQRLRLTATESERRANDVKEARTEYESLHQKFVQTVNDLDELRHINMAQKGKLERYALITSASSANAPVHNDAKTIAKSEGDAYRPVLKAVK